MEDGSDDLVRTLFLMGLLLGSLVLIVGGFLTRAAGRWLDGGRLAELQQFGPLVWGHASVPGGHQVYRGVAFAGWVRLRRRDYGKQHLVEMGFTEVQASWMEGHMTGSLVMRRTADLLSGTFYGRRFSFGEQGINKVTRVEPVPRQWRTVEQGAPQRA